MNHDMHAHMASNSTDVPFCSSIMGDGMIMYMDGRSSLSTICEIEAP